MCYLKSMKSLTPPQPFRLLFCQKHWWWVKIWQQQKWEYNCSNSSLVMISWPWQGLGSMVGSVYPRDSMWVNPGWWSGEGCWQDVLIPDTRQRPAVLGLAFCTPQGSYVLPAIREHCTQWHSHSLQTSGSPLEAGTGLITNQRKYHLRLEETSGICGILEPHQ